ncbi:MAG TPA: metallophosphoesterase family protein [Candidatus Hydrogenedentes bacterium]|nr:metallophosphoesterase family protein [Candidatus Hydrogenedentota bacterium]HNT86810.1 metallophosphoesterase family protein [Candidatus Hydrogenedentota bacterium]
MGKFSTQAAAVLVQDDATPEAFWRKRLELERRYRMTEGDEDDFHSARKAWWVRAIKTTLRLSGLYARGRRNAMRPVLKHVALPIERLPEALDGLRILHLSDFHFRQRAPQFAETAAACLDGAAADLCVMTGDFRFGYFGPSDHVLEQLATVLRGVSIREGNYAVLGNHDVSVLRDSLEDMGVRVLVNAGEAVAVGDATLWIGGVDDPHDFECASVPHAMRHAPNDAFRILLAHTPEVVYEARAHGVALCLCGHTHGGQVRFPFIGAIESNARGAPRQCLMGPWRLGEMFGHTSIGLGTTDLPVRYNCPPEATLLTLRRVESGDTL